jgi:hypothetical protein
MEITYKKTNNSSLFKEFEDDQLLNMSNCQNYVPLYTNFFTLNENNYNSINLNNQNRLTSITKKISENIFEGTIKDKEDSIITKNIFFKLSPLLDPYKYMAGKYDIDDPNLFNLPKFISNTHYKIMDINNSAYVDSFFTYLTSQLLNRVGFLHGLDFYGSYLGCKNNYYVDIGDDIDILSGNDFFHQNTNKLFSFINSDHEDIFNEDSRDNKKRLELGKLISNDILNLEDITSLDLEKSQNIDDISSSELIYEDTNNTNNSDKSKPNNHRATNSNSDSEVSSRSSNTLNSKGKNNFANSDDSSENSSESSDEENIMVSINKFPIQIIALENCNNTLDQLFVNGKIKQEELECIIIQILMMLITYQKLFDFTHNDLHTNNIMYIETDRRYLYYKINNKYYKVRTFGKLFKIIDFGRAIYKYKNKLICSDSFHKEGDAATQYNCEPFYNDKKPIIEPNPSFDLCRLGCSIYDFITEKYEKLSDIHWPIHKIIMNWCVDDDKRNILYKNNDEERYPDFKLYKMIARKVHNHIPINELQHKCFNNYIVSKKEIKKGSKIMNIDTIATDTCQDTPNKAMENLQISNSHQILLDDCD